jgi:small conductance mechanosensitive channel
MESSLSTVQENVEQVQFFFSKDNLVTLFNKFCDWAVSFIGTVIVALIVWWIGKRVIRWGIKFVTKALQRTDLDIGVVKFIGSIVKTVLYAVLILIVVGILGIPTASLITVFGSAALAVGMSLQGSLSNFAGGILLLIFKPFTIGDYIVSGSCEGTVVSIELLYTKLHTIDNKTIMMPNGTLANSNITNVGAEENRRLDIEIGVGYQTDIAKAKNLLMSCLQNNADVIKDRDMRVVVKSLDESCITIETRVWVPNDKYWDTRFTLLEDYKNIFDANGIEIPFNQLDVHITGKEQ